MAETMPKGFKAPGKALWRAILADLQGDWELDRRELHFLERACRVEDQIAELEKAVAEDGATVAGSRGQTVVHPALSEARQLALVQQRLLGSLELSDPTERPATPAQARGRRAA